MAEEQESNSDKLMSRIKMATVVRGIKELFRKYPQTRMILPFAKEAIENITSQINEYLNGKSIYAGYKNGKSKAVVLDEKKSFLICNGFEVQTNKETGQFILTPLKEITPQSVVIKIGGDGKPLEFKAVEDFTHKVYETGLLDEITDEDRVNYDVIKNKIDNSDFTNMNVDNIVNNIKEIGNGLKAQ